MTVATRIFTSHANQVSFILSVPHSKTILFLSNY